MTEKLLEIKTALQIRKPPSEVFEAIVDPEKMKNYFISKSTGWMEEGKNLTWKFPEFKMKFPVRIGKIKKNEYISFRWDNENRETLVEIMLAGALQKATIVTVTEKSMKMDEAGLKWLTGNTQGWANFLACLKAYLEHGINLRKGAFDFMSDKK